MAQVAQDGAANGNPEPATVARTAGEGDRPTDILWYESPIKHGRLRPRGTFTNF